MYDLLKVAAVVGLIASIRIQVLIQVSTPLLRQLWQGLPCSLWTTVLLPKMYSELQLEIRRNYEGHLDLFLQQSALVLYEFTVLQYSIKECKLHFYPEKDPKTNLNSIYYPNEQKLKQHWQFFLAALQTSCLSIQGSKELYKFRTAGHVQEKDFTKLLMFSSSFQPPQ